MELARQLLEEARADNQRRLLVLSGTEQKTRKRATEILDQLDVPLSETTYVGPSESFQCEMLDYGKTAALLGTTRTVIVLDCHDRCEPNHLGQLVGAVDGGGLFVLLTPPLSTWAERRDAFDETLAVPPFDVSDVSGTFRRRLVETLRQHRGVALVDVDTGTVERDGLVEDAASTTDQELAVPADSLFPELAYEQCLTQDQIETLQTLERLTEPGQAVVVEANRGRGKSAVAGFAAGCLALAGKDIAVTGPQYRNVETLLDHAEKLLDDIEPSTNIEREGNHHLLETDNGRVQYVPSDEGDELTDEIDCLFVDEAAALPVRWLTQTLDVPSVAYVTTTHGYEGTGRGFAVRFRDHLIESHHNLTERQMHTPIRYAPGDPVEVWSFRALALDARPPVAEVVDEATPESVSYRSLSSEELLADESLLREVFGLLVLAHYRTEPNDLMRLLDAPNVSVHGLFHDGFPVSVALLAREGGLAPETRAEMYEGSRVRGNMIPDVLTSQLRDESAGETTGYRVVRIATHGDVRSRGVGSRLVDELADHAADADWLGAGYGGTPELVRFWNRNEFSPVHLSTTRNRRSGEHSVIMLRPVSTAGEELLSRHAAWFQRRLPSMLPDTLRNVDPDVVRAVLGSMRTTPHLELTNWEWRHIASVAAGPGIFEIAPHPIRRVAFLSLADGSGPSLSSLEERLLVQRVLQLHSREEVTDSLDYHSGATAMRTLGDVVRRLAETYGPEYIAEELSRFE